MANTRNAEPFFTIVMEGLRDEVDGTDFWDAVDEDAVFEFLYYFPGFPQRIVGRRAYEEWFEKYDTVLHSADGLRAYVSVDPSRTVILEYAVHGTVPSTGKAYDNHFCSIVTVKNRKIVYWRDYMDSFAVVRANTAPEKSV